MNNNRGRPLPASTVKEIQRLRESTGNVALTARATGTSRPTVYKYTRKTT